MSRYLRSNDDERGAMLLQAGLALLGLIALSTFIIDFGILWVGRAAAQNSADAGALAGATALAFDDFNDRTSGGPAVQSAWRLARGNHVWDVAPAVDPLVDITFPLCPDGSNGCIRVNVFRDSDHTNALPTIFGGIVGLGSQNVKATATAEVLAGNASNCIKPWVVVDKWIENSAPPNTTFDKWIKSGNNTIINPAITPDVYIAPSQNSLGTGYNAELPPTGNLGLELTLKAGSPSTAPSPGFYYPVDLPLPPAGGYVTGGNQYRTNIATCTGWPVKIGDVLPPENGNMVGPTAQGMKALYNEDPGASWDTTTNSVKGSCAPGCAPISPRIVAIALVNPDLLQQSEVSTGGKNINLTVTNIMGFFINKPDNSGNVTGYLTHYPGLTIGTPTNGPGGSFLVNPIIVR